MDVTKPGSRISGHLTAATFVPWHRCPKLEESRDLSSACVQGILSNSNIPSRLQILKGNKLALPAS